jgi:uncharacterized membrane protein YGL010W
MLGQKTWDEWIAAYSLSHTNPTNKMLHLIGIPSIGLSIVLLPVALVVPGLFAWLAALFVFGWVLQFAGHAIEGKPPEFFKDWRFLFVGLRWWIAKVSGR